MGELIVVAGYLVRHPVGGYAWQAAHYLLGLRALGHDVWFYEDTGYYPTAYDPVSRESGAAYAYGVGAADEFLRRLGHGDRWVFADVHAGEEYGPGAGRARALLRDADLLVNVGGVNFVSPDQRAGRPSVYIDLDPGWTQLGLAAGDDRLRAVLDAHSHLFTLGENIGTERSPIPTGGYRWWPTRPPVVLGLWRDAGPPGVAYTTIGTWESGERDVRWNGETYRWSKRHEWPHVLDVPALTGARFEMAMNVAPTSAEGACLSRHGWQLVAPAEVSTDLWRYRRYVRGSRGEFTVAKDLNVRLRSGWFSDRGACYLAAGRPVVMQDTGFGDVLPLGPGLHAFRSAADAVAAIAAIEADYARATAHATEVAREYLAADRVLRELLRVSGF